MRVLSKAASHALSRTNEPRTPRQANSKDVARQTSQTSSRKQSQTAAPSSQSYAPSWKQSRGESLEQGKTSMPQFSGRSEVGWGIGPVPDLAHRETDLNNGGVQERGKTTCANQRRKQAGAKKRQTKS